MNATDTLHERLATVYDPKRRLDLIVDHIARDHDFDPIASRDLLVQAEQLAVSVHALWMLGVIALYSGIAYYRHGHAADAESSLRHAYNQLSDPNRAAERGTSAMYLGELYRSVHRYEDADTWYDRALASWDGEELRIERARALRSLGEMYLEIGGWDKALERLMQALAILEAESDLPAIAACLVAIGTVYANSGDTELALAMLRRAIERYREAGDRYGEVMALSRLAGICRQSGDLSTALGHSLTAVAIYGALGDHVNAGAMLITIGAIHEDLGQTEEALQFYLKAHDTFDGNESERLQARALHGIGRLSCQLGDIAGAQLMLENALVIARQISDRQLQFQLHESLSIVHERLGDYHTALEYHRHYARVKDELAGEEKQKELAKLQVRYDIEKAEREREILRLKAEELENRMRQKEAELTGMALSMVQKNEVINEVKEKIAGLGKKREGGDGEAMRKILRELESGADAEKAWKAFERQLDNTHHDFVRRLSERFPTLAPTELKICSLLKIDLKTKEIASLLCLSPRTVETHRYNITKKLDLPDGVRLTGFIAGI